MVSVTLFHFPEKPGTYTLVTMLPGFTSNWSYCCVTDLFRGNQHWFLVPMENEHLTGKTDYKFKVKQKHLTRIKT